MMQTDREGNVAIVRMSNGEKNPIDAEFTSDLGLAFHELRDDDSVRGVVLASAAERFFAIGLNLPKLLDAGKDEMRAFHRHFLDVCVGIYTYPKPVVAAIDGHATAGGCTIALCADYRVISRGRRLMGLNVTKLGVPVPLPAVLMLNSIVGEANAKRVVDDGELYGPDRLLELGMVDRVVEGSAVAEAVAMAGRLGEAPGVFAQNKRVRVAKNVERMEAEGGVSEEEFLRCWWSEGAQEKLREASGRF
jgi:enoyl-CoA hydratase/carnithine racemase